MKDDGFKYDFDRPDRICAYWCIGLFLVWVAGAGLFLAGVS